MELFIQSAQKLFKNYTVIKLNAYLIKFINTCLLRKKKTLLRSQALKNNIEINFLLPETQRN